MAAALGVENHSTLPGVSTSETGGIPRENRGYHGCLSL